MEMRWIWPLVLLATAHMGCVPRVPPRTQAASAHRNPGDVILEIPSLGPCVDQADRRLFLDPNRPVTVLVHGCNGSAGRFQALAEVFAFHGQQAIGFTYNDRDSLATSAGQLARALETLAAAMHCQDFTVIGHSQGGLIARKALVMDGPPLMRAGGLRIRLVTISAPFAGIFAARHCGSPVARAVSLGMVVPICWIVTGDKWRDITYLSPFITAPGTLLPQVESHLKIETDERGTCRRTSADGQCAESDLVFSLDEQRQAAVDSARGERTLTVKAGHVEIAGDFNVVPVKLIGILQQEGLLNTTEATRREALGLLLARLYGGPSD